MKKILIAAILMIFTGTGFGYDFVYQPNLLTRNQDPFKISERVMRFDDRIVSYDKIKNLYYREHEGIRYYCQDGSVTETENEIAAREEREGQESATKVANIAEQATVFRWVLQQHFGVGAETNEDVTEQAISKYFIQRRIAGTGSPDDASDAILLQSGFEAIKKVTEDETSWSLPWNLIPEIQSGNQ